MREIHDVIRDELGVGDDSYFLSPENMRGAIKALLELHRPFRIYDPCGHGHVLAGNGSLPEGVVDVEDVGLVCEAGLAYVVCRHCCAGDGCGQSEECASSHDRDRFCDPCPTVRLMAQRLDLIAEAAA